MKKGKICQEIVLEIPLRLYYKATPNGENVSIELISNELDLIIEFLEKVRCLRKTVKVKE